MTDSANPATGGKLIVVEIHGQKFAIDVMAVREIRGWTPSTQLPKSPAHILGMINLRGSVLPVVDLGARLGLGDSEPHAASVVIVAQIDDRLVGLKVDAVCDIMAWVQGAVFPAPDVGEPQVREFVRGLITTSEAIITLLSLDRIIPRSDALAA